MKNQPTLFLTSGWEGGINIQKGFRIQGIQMLGWFILSQSTEPPAAPTQAGGEEGREEEGGHAPPGSHRRYHSLDWIGQLSFIVQI